MPGFNTLPAVGGGGGQANMTYVASIHMQTYNRSWAQGGTAGNYALYSTNQENGYAYFVGSGVTTGIALNKLAVINHSFTRIDIIAPQNDMVSLYKAKVKATTTFANPFAAFASFPAVITTSGNFVLPNNALPLVNVLVSGPGGGGGHGEHNGGGGGGAGGGVVFLTAFQAVGTTGVTIGGGHGGHNGQVGTNKTFFGNVWALGGGGGGHSRGHNGGVGANGGGGAGGNGSPGGAGLTVANGGASHTTSGSPAYHGGFSGGNGSGNDHHHRSGGGGGASQTGATGSNQAGGHGGNGFVSDIEGTNHSYGAGGPGSQYDGHGTHGYDHQGIGSARGHGARGGTSGQSGTTGSNGAVVVRYYIP